jgi:hypothetical protein
MKVVSTKEKILMTLRSKVWVVSVLFSLINLGGAVVAAAQGEPVHAGVHAGLLVLGADFVWRLAPTRARRLPHG